MPPAVKAQSLNHWATEDPEEAKKKFEELKQGAIDFFNSMSDYLPTIQDLWEGLTDAIKLLIKVLKQIVEVFSLIKGAWDLLTSALSSGIDALTEKFVAFGKTIENALKPYAEKGQAFIGQTTSFSDDISIEVSIRELRGVKLFLSYVMKNDKGETVCTAESSHAFLDANGRPLRLKQDYPELFMTLTDLCK